MYHFLIIPPILKDNLICETGVRIPLVWTGRDIFSILAFSVLTGITGVCAVSSSVPLQLQIKTKRKIDRSNDIVFIISKPYKWLIFLTFKIIGSRNSFEFSTVDQ